MLPPRMDHGCASGLWDAANNNTADAPIGAISNGSATPSIMSILSMLSMPSASFVT